MALAQIKALQPRAIEVTTGSTPFFLPARRMYEALGFVASGVRNRDASVLDRVDYTLSR